MKYFTIAVILGSSSLCVAAQTSASAPVLPISSAEDAFASMFTPKQRESLIFDDATFSPDGRYLAFAGLIEGKDSSFGSEVLRYDLKTRRLMLATPEPTSQTLPEIDEFAWSGDVLYSALTYTWGVGRPAFFKLQDEVATSIDAYPAQLRQQRELNPVERRAGSYLINGQEIHGGMTQLLMGRTMIAIANGAWTSLDNPPTLFFWDYKGLHVFYLRTRKDRIAEVPNSQSLLAVRNIENGFRVAYSVAGRCGVKDVDLNTIHLPMNLCFVDIPDQSRVSHSSVNSIKK